MKQALLLIPKILIFFILLAVLEFNKNTVLGWILEAAVFAVYLYLSYKVFAGHNFLAGAGLFLGFLALSAAVIFISWPPVKNVPAVSYKNPVKTEVITTKLGDVRGVFNEDQTVEVFTGIPYAKPPVGELRWKEPQDAEPWTGILEADHFAPMGMQPVNLPIYDSLAQVIGYHDYKISLDDNYRAPVSEDSLYLNIWKPAGDVKDLPVLVYIHGGSLQTGQPWYADYSGEGLAKHEGIIVVNIAYRLGVFGFYADEELAAESPNHTTGNYGLLDMIKGLEWVRDNIAYFGGDPGNVTLAGESAGSAAVSALCTSPLAKGLFERVILESSTVASKNPPHSFRLFEEALKSGNELKARHNAQNVEHLRNIPAEKLANEAYTQHHITVDGYVLERTPYESYKLGLYNEKAILHGYNSDEAGPFVLFSQANMKNYESKIRNYFGDLSNQVLELYPAGTDEEASRYWREIYGAVFFSYPHYCLNRLAAENGIPVYEYMFSKENRRLGPWHSGEEVYLYHNIPYEETDPELEKSKIYHYSDVSLSQNMAAYVASYCENGKPQKFGLPTWENNITSEIVMEFGEKIKPVRERSLRLYEVLDQLYGWE